MNASQQKKILILEDESIVAGIYKRHLENNGFSVKWIDDIQEGFYEAQKWKPNALILDLVFPSRKGIELTSLDVLKKLKAQKQFASTLIIVLTNAYMSDMAEQAAEAGADWILDKSRATPSQVIEIFNKEWRSWWETKTLKSQADVAPAENKEVDEPTPKSPDPTIPLPTTIVQVEGETTKKARIAAGPSSHLGPVVPAEWVDSRADFAESCEKECKQLRELFLQFAREKSAEGRTAVGRTIEVKLNMLMGAASALGFFEFAGVSAAMQALIREILTHSNPMGASTTRTLAASVDFLPALILREKKSEQILPFITFSILAVDDDIFSRQAIKRACLKVGLKVITVPDPQLCLNLIEENKFDLILLDVEMPDISGFDLCKNIRSSKLNQKTRVLFVTSHDDLQSRSQSLISGGNDFIVKPFPFMELGLKILIASLQSSP